MREAVNGVEVRWVGNGHGDTVVVLEDRYDAILAGDVARDGGDDIILNLDFAEVDDFRAEMGGLGLGDVGRPHHLVGHHQVHHAHARLGGFAPQFGHLLGGHKTQVHQDID